MKNLLLLTFTASLTLFLVLFGCNRAKNHYETSVSNKEMVFTSILGDISFTVEVFDTNAEREKGLMYRTEMPKNHGALFVFPETKNHVFWMKNTPLALDLIFFDENFKVVGTFENSRPFSLKTFGINEPSRYVLEVLAGTVKHYGINEKTRVSVALE